MKILVVNVVAYKGSTGNITSTLVKEYRALGHEVFYIYGRGEKIDEPNTYKCCYELESKIHHFFANFNDNIYGGMPLSTLKLKRYINKLNPDVIHLHCLNGYFVNIYALFKFLKKKPNIKVVLTNHAEFMYTANCGYTKDCDKYLTLCHHCPYIKSNNGNFSLDRSKKYFNKLNKALSNMPNLVTTGVSPWLTNNISKSLILKKYPSFTVLNGVDLTEIDISDKDPFKHFRNQYKHILLTILANFNDPNKGGHNLFKLSKTLDKNYLLVVVGNPPLNLKNSDYPNIVFIGNVDHKDLYNCYAHADITLLFSYKETFSMVVAESLLAGTPVIGFVSGGPESIAIKEYTTFVKYGDIDALKEAITKQKPINKEKCIELAKKKYDSKESAKEYIRIMENEK